MKPRDMFGIGSNWAYARIPCMNENRRNRIASTSIVYYYVSASSIYVCIVCVTYRIYLSPFDTQLPPVNSLPLPIIDCHLASTTTQFKHLIVYCRPVECSNLVCIFAIFHSADVNNKMFVCKINTLQPIYLYYYYYYYYFSACSLLTCAKWSFVWGQPSSVTNKFEKDI